VPQLLVGTAQPMDMVMGDIFIHTIYRFIHQNYLSKKIYIYTLKSGDKAICRIWERKRWI